MDGSFSVKPLKQKQIVSPSEGTPGALLRHVHTRDPLVSGLFCETTMAAAELAADATAVGPGLQKSGQGHRVCLRVLHTHRVPVLTTVVLSLVRLELSVA